MMSDLPQPIAELVDVLAAMPGTVAVVLGGSRALGVSHATSDWDLGVFMGTRTQTFRSTNLF
jgi:hypothetical protein